MSNSIRPIWRNRLREAPFRIACQDGLGHFFPTFAWGYKGLLGWFGALFFHVGPFDREGDLKLFWQCPLPIEPTHFKKGLPLKEPNHKSSMRAKQMKTKNKDGQHFLKTKQTATDNNKDQERKWRPNVIFNPFWCRAAESGKFQLNFRTSTLLLTSANLSWKIICFIDLIQNSALTLFGLGRGHIVSLLLSICLSVQIRVGAHWKNLTFLSYEFGKGQYTFYPVELSRFADKKIKFVGNTKIS